MKPPRSLVAACRVPFVRLSFLRRPFVRPVLLLSLVLAFVPALVLLLPLLLSVASGGAGSPFPTVAAGELGFLEDYALGGAPGAPLGWNRDKALEQLIAGTEEAYFYRAIQLQHSGKLDEVEKLLPPWIEKHGRTARVIEIENRQALLRYPEDPRKTLDFLRDRLSLRFDHQREILGEKPKLPTALDPALISPETLTKRALDLHGSSTDGFEDRALEGLSAKDLGWERRRHLLSRLRWPGIADLPRLVVDDLNSKDSGGFGSLEIHKLLLQAELDECLRLKPNLLNDSNFENAYLLKLWPPADVDWQTDAKAREAFLDRLWAFVSKLSPAHNSRKVHILHHRLLHDRALGVWNKERFLAYLALPRNAPYVNPKFLEVEANRRVAANLGQDYRAVTQLPAVGNDEPLVRSYLEHFFLEEATTAPYEPYLESGYLKRVFAETRLLAGLGNAEALQALLSPSELQALRDRVDLDFEWTTKTVYGAEEAVALDLHTKNVKTLIVKVFELNTLNFYRENLREIDTAVDLDGLVASEEKTWEYTEPPLRRVKRHFDFPTLAKRGTYVVEFIGGGKASRALVRKGKLHFLARSSVAGHVFTILDDEKRKVPGARAWLGGKLYEPDGEGYLTIPFSTAPGPQPVVLVDGEFATLETFDHEAENYVLGAGIHVEREALLSRGKAEVIVRPSLTVNGVPAPLAILEDPVLVVTSTDREGVNTSKEVKDFKLHEDRESTYSFQVPANLARIAFTLRARVENLSQGKKVDLADARSFDLNGIDATDKIEDLFLAKADGTYALELLGKTGEAKPDRPVRLALKHRDFRDGIEAMLQTNASGRVELGRLEGIEWLAAKSPSEVERRWTLLEDLHSYPQALHGRAGEAVLLPYVGKGTSAGANAGTNTGANVGANTGTGANRKPPRSEVSLLELRGAAFLRDRTDALALEGGYLKAEDLPAADYALWLKGSGERITIRIAEGKATEGYILSRFRQLEARNPKPLQIASVEVGADAVRIALGGATKLARVHVAATRYLPEYPIFGNLDVVEVPDPWVVTTPAAESQYVVGRDIGDEYRYVLERRYAKKYPGNLLARPSLLLNPWAVRSTETGIQTAAEGVMFEKQAAPGGGSRLRRAARPGAEKKDAAREDISSNLDFLGEGATVLLNLRASEDGVVSIPRKDLGRHRYLQVVAVGAEDLAFRQVSLPEVAMAPRDLRLVDGLDPQKHFTEKAQVTVVEREIALPDITTSELETYDTLRKVYGLFSTLNGNPTLVEFAFVLDWPKLDAAAKREKYSKYASHELNFFLFEKDPEFFAKVVRPYLENKLHKTFLDRWLLGETLVEYTKPWAWEQLNSFERILLARKIAGEPERTARSLRDVLELTPPDLEALDRLFKTAIRGRALETEDALALGSLRLEAKQLKQVEKLRSLDERLVEDMPAATAASSPAPPPAPATAEPAKKAASESTLGAEEIVEAAGAGFASGEAADKSGSDRAYFKRDAARRGEVRKLYRKLDTTQEWAENDYHHLPIESQNASLITPSPFWADYALSDGKAPFYSTHLAEAARNFTEMMLALAVLDLPFEAGKHETSLDGTKLVLKAGSPLIAFHKEILPAEVSEEKTPILVTQNYYRHGDRFIEEGGEKRDKFLSGELLVQVVYGCHVVITNPTSSVQKLDVLLQIPRGALPLAGGLYTRSLKVTLEPYNTWTSDYLFYFPASGAFPHFPVHVSRNEKLLAFGLAATLQVVDVPSTIDRSSWDYVSQQGTEDEVFEFLRTKNLGRVKLDRIAWRMRDKAFFGKAVALLGSRHAYEGTLWSYGVLHDALAEAREFLRHHDAFVSQCGAALESPLLSIDPVERKTYQHLEYWPLVNARAHRLGTARTILNGRFYEQYLRLLTVLSYRPAYDDEDMIALAGYLLLQDRVDEALAIHAKVKAEGLATKIQKDYFETYLAFSEGDPAKARAIASRYADFPVERWRNLFGAALAQLDEIEGKGTAVVDAQNRDQAQEKLASTEPSFELRVESGKVKLAYQNLAECRVNYYLMDVELLFSRNPFVGEYSGQFGYIRPNQVETVKLDPAKAAHEFPVPEKLANSNVLVEVSAAGQKKAQTHFSGALSVQVIESYAQARVTPAGSTKPLSGVYVKVYAKLKDGAVRFYKDGYTDLRGRFDYGSLSTNELDQVARFAILFLSPEHGAVVKEAEPPKR